MCIGYGTKRRIRRCIPCMCICICMWMCMCMWICMWMCMCAQHTHAVRARITCVVTSAPPELGGIPPHNSPFTNGTPLASPRWMHAAPRRTQVSYTRPTNPHNHTPTTRTQPHATWPQHNHTPTPTVMAQLIHPTAQVPISAAGAHQRSGWLRLNQILHIAELLKLEKTLRRVHAKGSPRAAKSPNMCPPP